MSRINGMCLTIWSLMEISISDGLLNFYLFISPLLFTWLSLSSHYSLLYCHTSFIIFSFLYFDYSSLHFILYKFDIISSIQSIFSPQITISTLSLSLSLSCVSFFFLIILIKVDGFIIIFFLNMCLGILFFVFNFPLQCLISPFYSFAWILIWANT